MEADASTPSPSGASPKLRNAMPRTTPRAPSMRPPKKYRLRPRERYVAEEDISFKEKVWRLVDDPSSSNSAKTIAICIMLLIFISGTAFVVETIPEYSTVDPLIWKIIEEVCVAFFTLEYVVRIASCPHIPTFLKDTLNFIDLLAIVPFYFEMMVDSGENAMSSAVFRVVRLVRVFRVFKISRYISWVKVFSNAILASAHPLGMLFYIMMIGLVMFSSAMYYAERGTFDKEQKVYVRADGTWSPFESIPAAFWWCIVTMTTVGYGDVVPITGFGRFIAGITSLCGILVLAIPITVISANFNAELEKMMRMKEIDFKKLALLKEAVLRAYYDFDTLEKKCRANNQSIDSKRNEVMDIEARIEKARDNLAHYVEEQIMFLLEKNHEMLMQQIGELVQKQKGIVVAQIETVLDEVPRFVREDIAPGNLGETAEEGTTDTPVSGDGVETAGEETTTKKHSRKKKTIGQQRNSSSVNQIQTLGTKQSKLSL